MGNIRILCLVLLAGIFCVEAVDLTELYNQKVVYAQEVRRSMLSRGSLIYHTGVLVTTESMGQWLVHKGNEYGDESETVVVDSSYMSSAWTYHDSKSISHSTVADYVAAGGPDYNLITDNCMHAVARMMALN